MNGDEARNAAALLIFAAHRVARALWRNHDNVNGLLWFNQTKVHVEAMGKRNGSAITNVRGNVVLVNVGLQFVRGGHHHQVCPLGSFSNSHHLKSVSFNLLGGGGTSFQTNSQFLGAGIFQVQGMGAALAAVANDGYFFALDQVYVSITIIIYAHSPKALR